MSLNFKQFGEGPPLIILHGLFGSLDNWQTLAWKYSEYFNTYIIDQRNHGKSLHSAEMNHSMMAQDINAFMESQDLERAHLIGHSMGGKVVQHLALQYPDRCNKVISADIGIKQIERNHDEIFSALLKMDVDSLESRKEADEFLEEAIPEFGVRQFVLKGLKRSESGYSWKFNLPVLYDKYDDIIAETNFDTPSDVSIRFLNGERSNYLQETDHSSILELFPNATFDTVSNAGHWLHADNPVEFYKKSLNFLR